MQVPIGLRADRRWPDRCARGALSVAMVNSAMNLGERAKPAKQRAETETEA
jgi:hypothetical protein